MGKKMFPQEKTAASLSSGEKGVVKSLQGGDEAVRFMAAFGFFPGAALEAVRRAPFGSPMVCRVEGAELVLRRNLAEMVLLEENGDIPADSQSCRQRVDSPVFDSKREGKHEFSYCLGGNAKLRENDAF